MKTTSLQWLSLLATCLILTGPAPAAKEAPTDKLTLEDIIFDASYLKRFLGPKTLITVLAETSREKEKSAATLAAMIKAITDSGLGESTQIFALPDGASAPVLRNSIPTLYPPSLHVTTDARVADFLVFIGADGAVKCLYCYHTNDRLYALATAAAVIKWVYRPAKIQKTAVPILAAVTTEFDVNDATAHGFKAGKGLDSKQADQIRSVLPKGPGAEPGVVK